MREIKFKAYDTELGEWLDSDELIYCGNEWFKDLRSLENCIPLDIYNGKFKIFEYSGLKDEDDKEIYEGDIVTNNRCNYVVVYHQQGFWLSCKDSKIPLWVLGKFLKIVGNICES